MNEIQRFFLTAKGLRSFRVTEFCYEDISNRVYVK